MGTKELVVAQAELGPVRIQKPSRGDHSVPARGPGSVYSIILPEISGRDTRLAYARAVGQLLDCRRNSACRTTFIPEARTVAGRGRNTRATDAAP